MSKAAPKDPRLAGVARRVLDDLPVVVEAVLGAVEIKVGELSNLQPGDSFMIDRRFGDPVELRVNGVIVAYGELVAVDDNFGVRITDIAGE